MGLRVFQDFHSVIGHSLLFLACLCANRYSFCECNISQCWCNLFPMLLPAMDTHTYIYRQFQMRSNAGRKLLYMN